MNFFVKWNVKKKRLLFGIVECNCLVMIIIRNLIFILFYGLLMFKDLSLIKFNYCFYLFF